MSNWIGCHLQAYFDKYANNWSVYVAARVREAADLNGFDQRPLCHGQKDIIIWDRDIMRTAI